LQDWTIFPLSHAVHHVRTKNIWHPHTAVELTEQREKSKRESMGGDPEPPSIEATIVTAMVVAGAPVLIEDPTLTLSH